MNSKLFCGFFLICYTISVCGVDQKTEKAAEILAKIKKDEKIEKLAEAILQQQEGVTNVTQDNKPTQKQLFKKRDLISLLSLLGFSGINFGFFYKLFTGANNKKTQIAKLQVQQQTMQEKLNSYEKSIGEIKDLQKDLEFLKQEKESLEKRFVDTEQTVDKSTQNLQELQELEHKLNVEIGQKMTELETKVETLVDDKISVSEKENQKARSNIEKKIQKLNEKTAELAKTTQALDKGIIEVERKLSVDFEQKRREIEGKLSTLVEQKNKEMESGNKSMQANLEQKIEKLAEKYQMFIDYKKEIEKVVQDQKEQSEVLAILKGKFDNFNADIKKVVEECVRRG